MNPTNSSTKPPDSSTNQSESSTNPSDSSIINDIDENHLIDVSVDDLVTEDSMKSPRPTLCEHSVTPGGSVYWLPHVDERITVPEEGKSYDTIYKAIEMYSNYAKVGGFQIKKAGQKTTKSGIVTLKYLMCNKEGAPRHTNIDTLDAKHSGKQKRQTTIHKLKGLQNEATSVVDECLFRLGDNVEKMGDFVEKLKKLRTEVEAEVPNHPSIEMGDVSGEHYTILKPNKKTVNNPTKVGNKGNITEKERNKRRKSEKDKALGVKKK
ncbi:FAR1 DNA binding domain-containing protein [Artemisia annua]|uniref:FAR1 DNA binding domain-containing protein n=1 Tax=Artemisia annua TaxID=35608 RepID=A0A2U1MMN5_ARTAN|nr:FAR1 DNA binding domain-containing protein [Artemisia annua]